MAGSEGEALAPTRAWLMAGMQRALRAAKRALQAGEVPVGAALWLPDGRWFVGRNRVRARRDPTAHAEMEAIRKAARALGNERLAGAVLFVSVEPCCMCAGAIALARIARLVYGAPEPKTGAVESRFALFASAQIHRPAITAGILEDEARALMRAFFEARR